MTMTDDIALLRQFVAEHAEPAFRELVRQRIDFVYATALRQVHGDSHLAEEVAQSVFLDLARKARELAARPNLTGWLYTSTRFAAAKALRSRLRRLNHETGAHAMQEILSARSPSEIAWTELRPVLDAAMHELNAEDREAILLRYFENRPLADVGRAIGLAENSARMRVDRAVEKLRDRLARRGITSTAAALSAALMAQPAVLAPAGLGATVAGATLAKLAAGGVAGFRLLDIFSRQAVAAGGAIALLGLGFHAVAVARLDARTSEEARRDEQVLAQLRVESRELREQNQRISATAVASVPVEPPRDPLARLRAVVALLKEGSLGSVRWSWAHYRPAIRPLVVDLFALNSSETQALLDAIEIGKREVASLAIAQASVQRKDREIVIEIPAVAGGREAHQRMLNRIRQTLGEERFALFQDVGFASALEQMLINFGLGASVLTVSHSPMPRNPQYPYGLSQARRLPEGVLGGSGSNEGGNDLEGLKLNLGPFVAFLPENF